MEIAIAQHSEETAGIGGGRACIAGHRSRVMDIVVWHEKRELSAEEVVYQYPGLNLANVHAALAYYFNHRQDIEEEFRKDEETVRQLLTHHPSIVQVFTLVLSSQLLDELVQVGVAAGKVLARVRTVQTLHTPVTHGTSRQPCGACRLARAGCR